MVKIQPRIQFSWKTSDAPSSSCTVLSLGGFSVKLFHKSASALLTPSSSVQTLHVSHHLSFSCITVTSRGIFNTFCAVGVFCLVCFWGFSWLDFFFYSIEFLSFSFQGISNIILFTIAGLPAVKGGFSYRCSTIAAYSRYEWRHFSILFWSM